MFDKVNELLARMDSEIQAKVDAKVAEKEPEMRAKAQEAYDAKVAEFVDEIRAEVEKEYETARSYLVELKAAAEPAPAEVVAEPLAPSDSNEPEVL